MLSLSQTNLTSATNALRILADAAPPRTTEAVTVKPPPGTPAYAARWLGADSQGVKIILSLEAAEKVYGADSFLMQTARGRGNQVEISQTTIPADKAAFKKDVLEWLMESSKSLPDFIEAIKAGKMIVHTVDEVPEFKFQPMVSFNLLTDGVSGAGGGVFTPEGFDWALYDSLESTRGQSTGSLGNHQFYAYFVK